MSPKRPAGAGGWRREDPPPPEPLLSDQDGPLAWTGDRDPDPLEAGHVSSHYDPGLERLVAPSPPRPSAGCGFVTGLLAGVVLGIVVGLLVAWLVGTTPRSAATVIPAEASWSGTQVQASSGNLSRPSTAPSPLSMDSGASSSPAAEPDPSPVEPFQEDDGGGVWGTPPPTDATLLLARVTRSGTIAQAVGHGPSYLAIPIGPGHLVRICGPGGCWTSVSTDAGPNHDMLVAGRIADVAIGHWVDICGVPAAFGLCEGSWTVVDGPAVTLPPTDVAP